MKPNSDAAAKKMKSRFTLLPNEVYRGVMVAYPNGHAFIPYGCRTVDLNVVPDVRKLYDLEGFVKFKACMLMATFRAGKSRRVIGKYRMDFFGNSSQIHDMIERLDREKGLSGVLQSQILEWEADTITEAAMAA